MIFSEDFRGKRVLITGHTGFKGTWLTVWLQRLGADVIGFSDRELQLFSELELGSLLDHWIGDIREFQQIHKCFDVSKPEIVIHLAAQSIVSQGYQCSRETMNTNLMGTVNVLECCREFSIKALLVVTSDKVYLPGDSSKNETDHLGGGCPYSASKAAVEMIVSGYRAILPNTFIATARAGNVIGAGDRGKDRLMVDIIDAWEEQQRLEVRFPHAKRPWQHVLDCLFGYLLLTQRLLVGEKQGAWNFAPTESFSVAELIQNVNALSWIDITTEEVDNHIVETSVLNIDSSKSRKQLGWDNQYSFSESIEIIFQDEFQLKQVRTSAEKRLIIIKRINEFSERILISRTV